MRMLPSIARIGVDGTVAGTGPVVLAPLLVGGAAFILARAGLLRKFFLSEDDSVKRVQRLARAILGNDKHSVAAALGRPQASAGASSDEAMFQADRWFYRLDARHQIAIAIEFVNDIARDVQVLHIPAQRRLREHAVMPTATT